MIQNYQKDYLQGLKGGFKLIRFNGGKYKLEQRKAKQNDLIQTLVYIEEDYLIGSILKVESEIPELDEILVCPSWYEEGMECWDIKTFLKHNDYLVLVQVDWNDPLKGGNYL